MLEPVIGCAAHLETRLYQKRSGCDAAVGDGRALAGAKIVSADSCIVVLIVAALWYALIQGHAYRVSRISTGSAWCKLLAEK